MQILKIYIIEDDMRRYRIMEAYFEAVNAELLSEKNVGEFASLLKQRGIEKVEINHIKISTVPSEELDFIDYIFDENFEDYIKKY